MLLTEFIPKSAVFPKLQATTKSDALRALCEALFAEQSPELAESALIRVVAREGTQSTAIGHGIALPHSPLASLDRLYCAVGRLEPGLDFGALDKKPVELIFLICYPPAQQSLYLNFVATIAKLLRDETHLGELLKADTPDALFSTLEQISKPLDRPEEAEQDETGESPPTAQSPATTASELLLLARLDLCMEMRDTSESGDEEIEQRITNLSALIAPETLSHYHRLRKSKNRAIAALEHGTCQGCFAKLPPSIVQKIQRNKNALHRCGHCNRFLYVI